MMHHAWRRARNANGYSTNKINTTDSVYPTFVHTHHRRELRNQYRGAEQPEMKHHEWGDAKNTQWREVMRCFGGLGLARMDMQRTAGTLGVDASRGASPVSDD